MTDSAADIWKTIPPEDYERHMSHSSVLQTQALAAIFQEIYTAARPRSVAVLGCTTGADFAHIQPDITQRVVGVDINAEFLSIARKRFAESSYLLELICGDVREVEFGRGFDLIHAALLFEYVEPAALVTRMTARLAPGGICSVVIQQHSSHDCPSVSPTGIDSLNVLEPVIRICDHADIERCFEAEGFAIQAGRTVPLVAGKSFWTGTFGR